MGLPPFLFVKINSNRYDMYCPVVEGKLPPLRVGLAKKNKTYYSHH